MKNKEIIHGFEVRARSLATDIDAEIIQMTHLLSGAELIFIDRPDDNKTFAIGFKTIPSDDTGVFHILEHTVLAGSEHFPVKDPMTALLSGSLYTYLNAFTYPDKTIYPVSSKNDKAFLDLVNVYLDAVLHPLVLKNKSIFMSEGHHYEYLSDGTLDISGIVYNEMKGAYSSPDELMDHYVYKNLYTGGTYSYDSGGFPDAIPTLTYEKFIEAHARFYHPENSVIVLDGKVDIDKTLSLIDSYLNSYRKTGTSFNIELGTKNTERVIEFYPVSNGEEEKNKSRLSITYPAFSHSSNLEHIAMSAIVDSIADSNSSPIKKPILDSGLCESVHLYYSASLLESSLTVQFLNVKDGCCDELIEVFDKTARELIQKGLDKNHLEGSLNLIEFKTREADFGSFPRGMVYMLSAMEYALYGDNVLNAFKYSEYFDELHARLSTDYFTNLLGTVLSKDCVTVLLKPDSLMAEREDKRLKERLSAIQSRLTDGEKKKIEKDLQEYEIWQETPDSPENMATIPTLEVSDIGPATEGAPSDVYMLSGAKVIAHDMESSGILYTDMYFDVSDADENTMLALRIFCAALSDLDTERGTATDFHSRVKHNLGDLLLTTSTVKQGEKAMLYINLRSSCLISKTDEMCELVSEYLYRTKYDDERKIKQILNQMYSSSHDGITADGLSVGLMRSAASLEDLACLNDLMYGYAYHTRLKNAVNDPDAVKKLVAKFYEIREKYLRRERLTVALTAKGVKDIAKKIVCTVAPGGTQAKTREITRPISKCECIPVESTVGYSAVSGSLRQSGLTENRGALYVLSSIISYELLWEKIRIKGGAYDTGFTVKGHSGVVTAYSYRDPSPKNSAEYFKSLINDLYKIISEIDITKYVISTIGTRDTVSTPRSLGASATSLYLNGLDASHNEKIRNEILATTKEELLMLCGVIEKALSNSSLCIVAPKKLLIGLENPTELEI